MKIQSAALAITVLLSIASCGREPDTKASKASERPKTVAVLLAPSGKGDKSYNDAALAGLSKAIEDKSIILREILPRRPEDYPTVVRGLARDGVDLVVGVGFLYGDTFKSIADTLSSTMFVLLDANVGNVSNVRSIVFRPEEGSFAAGAAAAASTQSGRI